MIQEMDGAITSSAYNVISPTDLTELDARLELASGATDYRTKAIKIGYFHVDR